MKMYVTTPYVCNLNLHSLDVSFNVNYPYEVIVHDDEMTPPLTSVITCAYIFIITVPTCIHAVHARGPASG